MVDDRHLLAAGDAAVKVALKEWDKDIIDPPRKSLYDPTFDDDRKAIDGYIREGVLLGGVQNPKTFVYKRDGDYEWCGAFAAYAWKDFIHADIRQLYWPSTYRLDCYGRYVAGFKTKNAVSVAKKYKKEDDPIPRKYLQITPKTTPEQIEEFGPRRGDILIVGTRPGLDYGTHVTLVIRWDPALKVFFTIEGNATGEGPVYGSRRQGVVTQKRPLHAERPHVEYGAIGLLRPGSRDIDESVVAKLLT